jgi:hypothetical protein
MVSKMVPQKMFEMDPPAREANYSGSTNAAMGFRLRIAIVQEDWEGQNKSKNNARILL